MTRRKRIKQNPRLLFWGKALTELKTMNAIVVLFYLHRGVSLEEVFYLTMVFSLATLVLEIPSGYLADRIGRKYTLIFGSLLASMSLAASFFAHGFWPFTVVFILSAASGAMFSGADEAFLYDSLKEVGREREMNAFNGKLSSARHIMKIFMPSIGALFAVNLLEWQFRTILAIDFFAGIISLIVLFFLVEPKSSSSLLVYERGIYKESIATIRQNPFLLRASLNKILVFAASVVIWRAYQPYLTDLGMGVMWLSFLYFLLHVSVFMGKWHLKQIESLFSVPTLLRYTGWLAMISALLIYLIPSPFIISASLLCFFFVSGIRDPVFSHAMNARIASKSRATTLSNLNVLKSVLDIPVWIFAGLISRIGIEYIFLIGSGLSLFAVAFFPVRKIDLLFPTIRQELDPEEAISP